MDRYKLLVLLPLLLLVGWGCGGSWREEARTTLAAADERFKAGAVKEAESLYRRALALDPYLADAYAGVARLRMRQGDWSAASEAWERALACSSTAPRLWKQAREFCKGVQSGAIEDPKAAWTELCWAVEKRDAELLQIRLGGRGVIQGVGAFPKRDTLVENYSECLAMDTTELRFQWLPGYLLLSAAESDLETGRGSKRFLLARSKDRAFWVLAGIQPSGKGEQ